MNYWIDPHTHEYITFIHYGYFYIVEWVLKGLGVGSIMVETSEEAKFLIWLINYVRESRVSGLI